MYPAHLHYSTAYLESESFVVSSVTHIGFGWRCVFYPHRFYTDRLVTDFLLQLYFYFQKVRSSTPWTFGETIEE